MILRVLLPLGMAIVGILLCFPALRIIAWVLSNSEGDIQISGINIAIALSTLGGALVVGSAWVYFWTRRS